MDYERLFQEGDLEGLRRVLLTAVKKRGSFQDKEVQRISFLLDKCINQEMGISIHPHRERFSSLFARPCDR